MTGLLKWGLFPLVVAASCAGAIANIVHTGPGAIPFLVPPLVIAVVIGRVLYQCQHVFLTDRGLAIGEPTTRVVALEEITGVHYFGGSNPSYVRIALRDGSRIALLSKEGFAHGSLHPMLQRLGELARPDSTRLSTKHFELLRRGYWWVVAIVMAVWSSGLANHAIASSDASGLVFLVVPVVYFGIFGHKLRRCEHVYARPDGLAVGEPVRRVIPYLEIAKVSVSSQWIAGRFVTVELRDGGRVDLLSRDVAVEARVRGGAPAIVT